MSAPATPHHPALEHLGEAFLALDRARMKLDHARAAGPWGLEAQSLAHDISAQLNSAAITLPILQARCRNRAGLAL